MVTERGFDRKYLPNVMHFYKLKAEIDSTSTKIKGYVGITFMKEKLHCKPKFSMFLSY